MNTLEVEPLAVLLRRFRLAAGLSQETLAERARLSRDAIAALERGRRSAPHPQTLARLASALELSPGDRQRLVAAGARPAGGPPAAAAVVPGGLRPHNLPAPLSRFVGRAAELDRLSSQLRAPDSDVRVLTLVGPGGVGKTRLALELARGLARPRPSPTDDRFGDGIWLVELAGLVDPTLVPSVAAVALDVREQPGQSAAATLIEVIGTRRLLIVLDSCEHVVGACAALSVTLLERCPGLRILATSREALGIPGEVIWPVLPLAVPDAQQRGPDASALATSEAVQLFVDRASLAQPTFALTADNADTVAAICRQLDGMPLAIELAAARMRALDLATIADGLADRFHFLIGPRRASPPQQQTLRASVEWSYDLLSAAEQRFFSRLAVFVGGWTVDAADPVAGLDEPGHSGLDLLARLVDKSLIMAAASPLGRVRYRMLETLRRYAGERLAGAGDAAAIRERHAHYYLGWLHAAEAHIEGPDQQRWLDRIEEELDNIRAALDWCRDADAAEDGLRVAWALALLGWLRGHLNEVDARLASLLAPPSGTRAPEDLRAKALVAAGYVAFYRGEVPRARQLIEDGLASLRRHHDPAGTGQALTWLGLVLTAQGQYDVACSAYHEAHELFAQLGDAFWTARVATNLGRCLNRMGQYAEATRSLEQALALRRSLGDARGVANTLTHVVDGLLARGEHDGIEALLDEALAIAQSIGDRFVAVLALVRLGGHGYAVGDLPAARGYLVEALEVAQRSGFGYEIAKVTGLLSLIARDEGDVAQARTWAEDSLRRGLAGTLQAEVAFARYVLGDLAVREGRLDEGRAHLAASLGAYLAIGRTLGVALAGARLASLLPPATAAACLAGAAEATRDATRLDQGTVEWRELGRALDHARVLREDDDLAAAWARAGAASLAQRAADVLLTIRSSG